ncbi:MAG: hypothetical protein Q8Q35_02545 [Nanoarchaeota archaeon]|nr:hypothetical protein [Nanoarchaeota archaeon]
MTSLFPIKDPRIVTLGEHRTELGLTEEENQFLRDNGYEVMSLLGEGNTRRTYLARYLRGGIDKLRVVKIPKSEIDDETSPTTAINMSKGDLNIQEVSASNLISHPNIITTLDSLRLGSRTINVEEHFPESQDLESLVGIMGPLRDSSYDGIMGQVLDAVEYVNIEESMLLRDNKPSNVLVNKRGHVKLTDLQNAKRVVDVRELTLPTRGGTPYTHPRMLNAMLEGRLSKADLRSETYAVGGIGYFSSTGENPFGYKLIQDENGVPISVGGEEFRVAIQEDGKIKTRIDEEAHEKKLRRMVKILPRHRRDPIYRALTLDENKAYSNISQLKIAAKKKSGGFWRRAGEQVVKNIRPALIGGAIVGALGGLTLVGVNAPKEEEKPTLSQILRDQDYRDFSLEALDGEDKNYALALLQDDFEELRDKLPGFLKTVRGRDQGVTDKWLDQHLPFLTFDAKFT